MSLRILIALVGRRSRLASSQKAIEVTRSCIFPSLRRPFAHSQTCPGPRLQVQSKHGAEIFPRRTSQHAQVHLRFAFSHVSHKLLGNMGRSEGRWSNLQWLVLALREMNRGPEVDLGPTLLAQAQWRYDANITRASSRPPVTAFLV